MPMMYIKSSIWSGFEIKNWIEDHFKSSPKLVGIWTVLRCIFVPNLEIVTSIGGELWHGQAQNGVNCDFEVKFDLEGQSITPPPPPPPPPTPPPPIKKNGKKKTIGILTKVFYIYGPNLVIPASTGDELLRGQAHDWGADRHTQTQTDGGNDNTRRPKLASGKKISYQNVPNLHIHIFAFILCRFGDNRASPLWCHKGIVMQMTHNKANLRDLKAATGL